MTKQVRYLFLLFILLFFQAKPQKNPQDRVNLINAIKAAEKEFRAENFPEAIVKYLKAAEIAEIQKDTMLLADIYIGMGVNFFMLQNETKSKEYFNTALSLYSAIKNDRGISDTWITLGNISRDDKEGLAYYQKALAVKERLKDSINMSACYNNIGNIFSKRKDHVKAMYYFKKALAIDERSHRKKEVIGENINIGSVYFTNKDYNKAIEYYSKGESLAKEAGNQYLLENAWRALSDAYAQTGNYKEAFQYYQKHIALRDSLLNKNINEKIAAIESKYQLEKKQKEIGLLKNIRQEKELALQTSYNKISEQKVFSLFMVILSVVIFLFAFIVYRQYRKKAVVNKKLEEQKKKIEDSLEQNEKLRLALQYDLNQYKQLSLRKQMNPHFIFNSLNSIQSFIIQNDKLSANLYLSKFANLTRRVLDNLRLEYVSIKNEIETLKLYIELEQKRFENKFEFNIEIDPEIDPALLALPPLILQPYVENAIWHGLLHKETPGKLDIKLVLKNNLIICIIEDDGIGREAAMKLKQNREQKHESHGTDITLKRLELINSISNSEIKVEFTDIKNEKGETGTRVVLTFPVVEILSLTKQSIAE